MIIVHEKLYYDNDVVFIEKLRDHCQNKLCYNFTSKADLSGTWCQDECFIEFETGEKTTRKELLEMKIKEHWDMEEDEIREAKELGLGIFS